MTAVAEHKGWKVRVFRMAVSPEYATPWCGWADKDMPDGTGRAFNKEAATPEAAVKLVIEEIDRKEARSD